MRTSKPIYIKGNMVPAITKKKLKIQTATGHYLINWDDILSLRVCVVKPKELHLQLLYKSKRLRKEGKLSNFTWIDDEEHEMNDLTCITRRWAKNAIFIPNSPKENTTKRTTWDLSEGATLGFGAELLMLEHQPAFGVHILWNREWWRPVLILYFWQWILQIGWLVD